MNPKISICFPSVNDELEAVLTAQSIRETAGDAVEICVCDDAGANTLSFPPELNVRLYRNFYRIGSGGSRHVLAEIATSDWMLMLDSHCRLEKSWLDEALAGIELYPNASFSGVCKGFTPKVAPFGTPAGTYYGGELQFIGKNPNGTDTQVLSAIWGKERDDMAEISTVLGANYLVNRKRFLELGSMNLLRVWGCEEEMLSLKAWLSGGEVRLMRGLVSWHRFRDGEKLPFHNSLSTLLYNRLLLILTIFPPDMAKRMIAALPRNADLNTAQEEIRKDWRLVEAERAHNRNIFIRSPQWLMEKFNIPML